VRRALAIQLIVNPEWGLASTDNPPQGCYIVDELTDQAHGAGPHHACWAPHGPTSDGSD